MVDDAEPPVPAPVKAALVIFYANVYLWAGLVYGVVVDRVLMPPPDTEKNKALVTLEVALQVSLLAVGNYIIRSLAHGMPVAMGMTQTTSAKKYKTDFAMSLAISLTATNMVKKTNMLFPKPTDNVQKEKDIECT